MGWGCGEDDCLRVGIPVRKVCRRKQQHMSDWEGWERKYIDRRKTLTNSRHSSVHKDEF